MQTARQEQIDSLLKTLSREELCMLLEQIAQRLRLAERPPQRLYGAWKEQFPENVDIDDTLHKLRSQWTGDDVEEPKE